MTIRTTASERKGGQTMGKHINNKVVHSMGKKIQSTFLALCLVSALVLFLEPSSVSAANSSSVVYPRTKLKGVTVTGYPYEYGSIARWTIGKNNIVFKDKNGDVGLFSYNDGKKPTVYIFDKDYNITSTTTLKLPSHDAFGTFAVASDGDYYVVLGHNNTEENGSKVVVSLLKVSAQTGEVIKKGELKGKHFGGQFTSISVPFDAGTADLVETNGNIYIHMSYEMFKASDGNNHQAANLFVFNAQSLKPTEVKTDFYVSHSFNQMIKLDGSTVVTLSHGDANPRAIRLATLDKKGNYKKADLFTFNGSKGKNETGTTVNGLEIGTSNYLVTGLSVTHNNPVNGKYSPKGEWNNGRNVYLSVINKKGMSVKNAWLTTFDPTNKDISITEPRIFKSDNSFVVVYSVSQNDESYTEFVTLNESGDVLARNKKNNTAFYTNTYPLLHNNKIIWIAPYVAGRDYSYVSVANTKVYKYKFEDTNRVYLFEVDISDPKSPRWVEGVRPKSIVINQSNGTVDWDYAIKLTAKVLPDNSPFDDIVWAKSSGIGTITSDGYVLGSSVVGGSGVFLAMSKYDTSVNSTVTIKSNARAKLPSGISTAETSVSKQAGLYSKYQSFVLPKGYQTKSIQLKNSTGKVPEYYLTSSDESIVKIKDSTTVVGKKVGTVTVYFHTRDQQHVASCEVAVTPSKTDGIYITQMPKTNFALNEPFDATGFTAAVVTDKGSRVYFYNDNHLSFCVSDTSVFKSSDMYGRGRLLTKAGSFMVTVYAWHQEASYTIKVGNSSAGADNSSYTKVLEDGRYSLRCMYNYMNIASDGGAELRKVTPNPVYEVKSQTDGTYTIKTINDKYLGISDTIADGVQLKEVDSPYYWKLYSENNNDIFSIRPASDLKMVVNAAGQKNTDGTWIILWTHEDTNAPNNAEFRFIPVE